MRGEMAVFSDAGRPVRANRPWLAPCPWLVLTFGEDRCWVMPPRAVSRHARLPVCAALRLWPLGPLLAGPGDALVLVGFLCRW